MFIIFSFPSYKRTILVFILRYVSADTKEVSTIGQVSQMLCCLREKAVDGQRACASKTADLYHIPSSEALGSIEEEGSERL